MNQRREPIGHRQKYFNKVLAAIIRPVPLEMYPAELGG